MPKGEIDTFKYAQPIQKIQFSLMIWAAVYTHFKDEFPLVIWNQEFETAEEKEDNINKLREMNSQRMMQILNQRQNCAIPGTAEFEEMSKINIKIDKENARRQAIGQRGRL